jgi:troponin T
MAEFEKWKSPPKANFVISKKLAGEEGEEGEEVTEGKEGKKSKEQLEAEKRAILRQRIKPLEIDGYGESQLTDKAKELHNLIHRLEGEKYDLEKRFKQLQVEMMELAERARQANRVGKEGLKRIQTDEDSVDKIQERFAGAPAKVEMYSKYERQKDKRSYVDRKVIYTGPQFVLPPERIRPTKIVRWSEEGLPIYEESGAPAE